MNPMEEEQNVVPVPDLSLATYHYWCGIMSGKYVPGNRLQFDSSELTKWKHVLTPSAPKTSIPSIDGWTVENIKAELLRKIRENSMLPWYEYLCHQLEWEKDDHLIEEMKQTIETEFKKLDEAIEDAEKNLGENEIREAYTKKAQFISKIGDKDKALFAFRIAYDRTHSLGQRLDIVFHQIRIGLFFGDYDVIRRYIQKAKR
jgi:tetratricopeptide (TPR) repeat protein